MSIKLDNLRITFIPRGSPEEGNFTSRQNMIRYQPCKNGTDDPLQDKFDVPIKRNVSKVGYLRTILAAHEE